MDKISKLLGFFIILKESIKILPRNGKFMASIALLSLLIPSLLIYLFTYLYQSMMAVEPLIFAVEIIFFLIFLVTSHLFSIATILVSANSYHTNEKLTKEALFSSIKKTWRSSFGASAVKGSHYWLTFAIMFAIILAIVYTNLITIGIAIFWVVSVIIFQMYSSVVVVLSVVVTVLEEKTKNEAVERAEDLVKEGQHFNGFMLNLFLNLVGVIVLVLCWILLRGTGYSSSLTTYGLLFFDLISVLKMLIFVGYTVFYFQCRKHCGEEIDVMIGVGDMQYTQLLTTTLLNDMP